LFNIFVLKICKWWSQGLLILNENNLHIYTFLHIRRCGLQSDNLEKKIGKKLWLGDPRDGCQPSFNLMKSIKKDLKFEEFEEFEDSFEHEKIVNI
jgi:hypothetical protein